MRDFTPGGDKNNSGPDQAEHQSNPAEATFSFNGVSVDGDPAAAGILKKYISGVLGPMGVSGISFVEPQEIVDARARIRGREDSFRHVTDGTPAGCLCGSRAQHAPPRGSLECPVCEILDC